MKQENMQIPSKDISFLITEQIDLLKLDFQTWITGQRELVLMVPADKNHSGSQICQVFLFQNKIKETIDKRVEMFQSLIEQLNEKIIVQKLYEKINGQLIIDFLDKILNNFQGKMELFDDILKIDLIPNYSKITKRTYSKSASIVLKTWFLDHFEHPYPSKQDIYQIIEQTQLKEKQILNWFINSRNKFKDRSDCDKSFKKLVNQRFEELLLKKEKKRKLNQ